MPGPAGNVQLSPSSPLNGALAGINLGYGIEGANQDLRAGNLQFMANMNKYQNEVADNPVLEAQRAANIGTADQTSAWNAQGGPNATKNATLAGSILDNQGKGLDNSEKTQQLKASVVSEVADQLDAHPPMGKNTVSWWADSKKQLQSVGLPVTNEETPSDETRSALKAAAKAAQANTKEGRQGAARIAEINTQAIANTNPALASSTAGASTVAQARAAAELDTKSTLATQKTKSDKEIVTLKAQLYDPKTLEGLAVKHINQGDTNSLQTDLEALWELHIKSGPGALEGLKAMTTPSIKEEWMARTEATLRQQAVGVKADRSGGGGSSTTPTTPKESGPTKVNSQAEYDALPKGATYIDSNGTPGKKK